MRTCRIHVVGASGARVTTLGRVLADALGGPHHDTDDYFWLPTTAHDGALAIVRSNRAHRLRAVSSGGWRYQETEEFIEWASHYDDGTREGRKLSRHKAWLETLHCPVIHLDGTLPVADLVDQVVRSLG